MDVMISTMDDSLDKVYDQFVDEFGFGPCGAYSALRRDQGWGDVAVSFASDGQTEFTHYVVMRDGAIVDLTNPMGEELFYSEVEILDSDEMPELCEDGKAVSWLKERII